MDALPVVAVVVAVVAVVVAVVVVDGDNAILMNMLHTPLLLSRNCNETCHDMRSYTLLQRGFSSPVA